MTVTNEQIEKLRRWAEGSLPFMAAVSLLTNSPQCNKLWPAVVHEASSRVWIDPERALGNFDADYYSSGERAVGLLVMALAGYGSGVPLSDLALRLDPANASAFKQALKILTDYT